MFPKSTKWESPKNKRGKSLMGLVHLHHIEILQYFINYQISNLVVIVVMSSRMLLFTIQTPEQDCSGSGGETCTTVNEEKCETQYETVFEEVCSGTPGGKIRIDIKDA